MNVQIDRQVDDRILIMSVAKVLLMEIIYSQNSKKLGLA